MLRGTTLHFRCSFELLPSGSTDAKWADIVRQVRSWIAQKYPEASLGGKWIFEGGSTRVGRDRVVVQTASEAGNGEADAPQYWSLRLEHPDAEEKFRRWSTDIGLEVGTGRVLVSVATVHWVLPRYIGAEPNQPVPSAPGIVGRLLRLKGWRAVAGSEPLSSNAFGLAAGHGKGLLERLTDPERTCPILLITRSFPSGELRLDGAKLARLLAGAASVVVAESSDVDKELEWLLPRHFRCWGGMARVYQPGLRLEVETDSRRHRFFWPEQIEELTPEVVEVMLIRGIARQSAYELGNRLTSLEDVQVRNREMRLAQLKQSRAGSSDAEMVELLNLELESLGKARVKEVEEFGSRLKELNDWNDEISQKNQELERDLKGEQAKTRELKAVADDAERRARSAERRAAALDSLGSLPESLPAMIALLEELHSERIAFTGRARESAGAATINDFKSEMSAVWRCLWSLPTVLHRLFFECSGIDVVKQYREQSGFEMAMSEGRTTQSNPRLMRLRRDVFEGTEIDFTPHVKYGTDPRAMRVYFHVDRDRRRLVVGHCGDHLDTAGTQRMS